MEQPSSKLRLAAMAATFLALIAISVPFIWQHDVVAERSDALAPIASHDSGFDDFDEVAAQSSGGACMANAKPAPLDFVVKDLDGRDVSLASFKGKVILLNFWATWCGPCKAEIPGFVELQREYPDDLVILGYSVDDEEPDARKFAEEFKINYPILLGLGSEELQDAYGPIYGIPASFIISRDGRICKRHMGIAPKAVFEKEIKALL
jgi:thiol-disulfide isomerase/thioredoxin